MTYIEDYLQHICENYLNSLESTNSIYFSIYKQVTKGVGLTDRQYNLVLNKIQDFVEVDTLPCRIPLREIDRSKYITIVTTADVMEGNVYESYKENWKWIKVRFPFNKKDIVAINKAVSECAKEYYHKAGTHEHYVKCTALNAYNICFYLKNRNFNIDQEIIDMHDTAKNILENENSFKPVLLNNKIYNLPKEILEKIVGDVYSLQDKSLRYGYTIVNPVTDNTLASQISVRTEPEFLANPDTYTLNHIAESLLQLDRFPLVVLIEESSSYDQVTQIYNAFSGFIDNSQQSVMFRADGNDKKNVGLNDFIKQKQLNNWVDSSTKIVYIKNNKIPKVLLKSSFIPTTAFSMKSDRYNSKVSDWISFNCDLILYNDSNFSSFKNRVKW